MKTTDISVVCFDGDSRLVTEDLIDENGEPTTIPVDSVVSVFIAPRQPTESSAVQRLGAYADGATEASYLIGAPDTDLADPKVGARLQFQFVITQPDGRTFSGPIRQLTVIPGVRRL